MRTSDPIVREPSQEEFDPQLLVSIVICTHNRCGLLSKTIRNLLAQYFPPRAYEIIVIDNASRDQTRSIVESYATTQEVAIKYFYEPALGVSFARNSGLELARGIFVAYLDDDLLVAPGWLQSIVSGFAALHPEPGVVCGPVKPLWEQEPPKWLVNDFHGYLSMLDLSSEPTFIPEWGWFPEGNSAFRTETLRSIGGFATHMGRKGNSLLSGEGVNVQQQIRSRGLKIYYHPAMSVSHFVPAERLCLAWFLRRAYYQGVSNAIEHLGGKKLGAMLRVKYALVYFLWSLTKFWAVVVSGLNLVIRGFKNQQMIAFIRSRLEFAEKWGWLWGFITRSAQFGTL